MKVQGSSTRHDVAASRAAKKNKIQVKEMPPTSARVRVNNSRSFRVQGQGFLRQDYDQDPDGAGASGSHSTMSLASAYDFDGGEADEYGSPAIVDELVGINRTLEKQIETLRLRLEFDKKHHEEQKTVMLAETGAKLKSKLEEVNKLQNKLHSKDIKILELSETNHKRDSEIAQLKRQIETLNDDVGSAKTYANELVEELAMLTKERERLKDKGVLGDKDVEITALRKEVGDLKSNLTTLEKELTRAREVMKTQGGQLQFHEADKKTIQLKFKEELAKVTYSMRLEVEKMRDVMTCQWEEMRTLREQNVSMSQDIKDIRSLLINGCLDDDAKAQQQEQEGQGQSQSQSQSQGHPVHQATVEPLPVPQTARGGKTVYNQFNMGAMKPSLPLLNKEKAKTTRQKTARSVMK